MKWEDSNAGDFQIECAGVLHEVLLIPVLIYGSETVLWRERGRSGIRTVQMDSLRGLLDVRMMDGVLKVCIGELCRVTKGVDERTEVVWPCGKDGEGKNCKERESM